jgi:hypothetical protein
MRIKNLIVAVIFIAGFLLAAGLLLTFFVGDAMAEPDGVSPSFTLNWEVVGSGGSVMTSSNYILSSTSGQPVIGQVTNSNYRLQSGYWTDIRDWFFRVFAPLVRG